MSIPQGNNDLAGQISAERDPLKRFFIAREYLDTSNAESINQSILKQLLSDADDLIRSEAVDFLIISGGLDAEYINELVDREPSDLVYPRLWLALASTDPSRSLNILKDKMNKQDCSYERAYYDAAMYVASCDAYFLYDLCAIACSSDLAASHSAIDLLQIVASDRTALIRELVEDIRRQKSDNADKATAMLLTLENREEPEKPGGNELRGGGAVASGLDQPENPGQ